ncbi:MAG: hypothetical protein L0Z62_24915, partial [Gemmataceae bacterium]|nr:hypothetical protein [Gemmataceae bacterium]
MNPTKTAPQHPGPEPAAQNLASITPFFIVKDLRTSASYIGDMRPLAILAMLTLMAPRVATGQVVSVGPRLALGTGSALTAQAGMRA